MSAKHSVREVAAMLVPLLMLGLYAGCQVERSVGQRDASRPQWRVDQSDRTTYTDAPAPAPAATPTPAPAGARVGPVDQPGHVPVERGQARDQVTPPMDEPGAAPVPTPRNPEPRDQQIDPQTHRTDEAEAPEERKAREPPTFVHWIVHEVAADIIRLRAEPGRLHDETIGSWGAGGSAGVCGLFRGSSDYAR